MRRFYDVETRCEAGHRFKFRVELDAGREMSVEHWHDVDENGIAFVAVAVVDDAGRVLAEERRPM